MESDGWRGREVGKEVGVMGGRWGVTGGELEVWK